MMMAPEMEMDLRVLARNLLSGPGGPRYDFCVRALHRCLSETGEAGAEALTDLLRPALLVALSDAARDLGEVEELAVPLYAVERYWACRGQWLSDCIDTDLGDLLSCIELSRQTEALRLATDREEVDAFFAGVREVILGEDGTLMENGLTLLEVELLHWLEDALERSGMAEALSDTGVRALTLVRYLFSTPRGLREDFRLLLITGFRGELFLLTPKSVHTLAGEEGMAFLDRELHRLSSVLPLTVFCKLLQDMVQAAPPGGSRALEALAAYRRSLQTMFATALNA